MFAIGVAQLNVVRRDYFTTKDRRILPNITTIIQQKSRSLSACASFCSIHKACCVASYDRKTKQCILDKSCCPESEQSVDALMLKIRSDSLACPNGWLKNENKCYYFSDALHTWTDAKIACEAEEGMLVEVDSKCENEYVKMSASESTYWLGGTDEQEEGVWIWSHSQNVITFTDWTNTEPSNHNGNEHCLALRDYYGYAWNDNPCHFSMRFICEKGLKNLVSGNGWVYRWLVLGPPPPHLIEGRPTPANR
ncbi:C-type lectin mannose-binding isoform-like [Mytilus edulis]|uniref:C-type lectin mannose-binding isoform-like n=1 Tax=Mytilus edulis TaxID=6550 RepID=UPI0039F10C1E